VLKFGFKNLLAVLTNVSNGSHIDDSYEFYCLTSRTERLRVGLPRFISVTYNGEHRAWGARFERATQGFGMNGNSKLRIDGNSKTRGNNIA
jgi:hypothetical protein